MKRIIALIFVLLLCGSALAATIDWSAMSDDEIRAAISEANAELSKRVSATGGALRMSEGTVLINQQGVLVTLTGNVETMGSFMELEVIVENNSDEPIYVNVSSSSINGWEVFGSGIADIGVGKKKKGDLMFSMSDADINSPSQIEGLELTLSVANADTWRTTFTTEPLTLVP